MGEASESDTTPFFSSTRVLAETSVSAAKRTAVREKYMMFAETKCEKLCAPAGGSAKQYSRVHVVCLSCFAYSFLPTRLINGSCRKEKSCEMQ